MIRAKYGAMMLNDEEPYLVTFNTESEKQAMDLVKCIYGIDFAEKFFVIVDEETGEIY